MTRFNLLDSLGALTAHRDMGKSHFLDLRDATGRIQIYLHAKEVGRNCSSFFVCWTSAISSGGGNMLSDQKREPTLKVLTFPVLAKTCGRSRKNGTGYRHRSALQQRYLDLLTNERSRAVFENASLSFAKPGASSRSGASLKWDTILQTMAGGAAAEPFKTRHNALGIDLYLRIALELYLKRLLVADSTRCSKSIATFAMKASLENTIRNSRC